MEIYLIAENNLRRSMKNRTRFLVAFILPIVLCILASFMNTDTTVKIRVGVIGDGQIQRILEQTEGITVRKANEKSYHTDLVMGKYQVIIGEGGYVITLSSEKKQTYYQELFNQILDGEKESVGLSKKSILTRFERSMAFLMTIFLIMATVNGAVLIKDKKIGTYSRCQYALNRRTSYAWGNYIYNLFITLLQVSVAFLFMTIIQQEKNISILQGLTLVLFISVTATIFSTILCLICKSDVQANICASSIATILSIIGGTFVAVNHMPIALQYVSVISPIRWVLDLYKVL